MENELKQLSLENIFLNSTFEMEKWSGFDKILPDDLRMKIEDFLSCKLENDAFSYSPDHRYLLFWKNSKAIYRRSFQAITFLINVDNFEIWQFDTDEIIHPTFSPTSGHIAYIKNNNLYVYDLLSKSNHIGTHDGQKNAIINGLSDWVYEEEFAFSKAFEWSNDGCHIAYYRFDEREVKEYTLAFYDNNYNHSYSYKYPKAGEKNSEITLFILDIDDFSNRKIPLESNGGYIPKIVFTKDNELLIFHLNRHQNELNIWNYNIVSAQVFLFYSEINTRYIDLSDDWFFFENQIMIFTSEKNGFRNIYLKNFEREIQLTDYQYDIDHIISIDPIRKWIYFSATYPSPMERQILACNFKGNSTQLTNTKGWNELSIKEDFTEAVIQHSTINKPPVWNKYTIAISEKKQLPELHLKEELISNQLLNDKLLQLELSKPKWISIPNSHGTLIHGWMLKPNDFNTSNQYPLLFCNYGGPGHQSVIDKYGTVSLWHQYIVNQGFIVVAFDNTGTGGRGEDFKKQTYLQLGRLEIEDQISIAKYLSKEPFIDAEKIGHWGWSFGGFMSSLAISKGADIFRFAVAIAPVTNWRYYDTIYTERYMKTPQENPSGYEDNSPFPYSKQIKGKLLLIHGEADDNVHVQNSMQWTKKLIQKNIPFDMAIYPDKNHRIDGKHTSFHLWKKITTWLTENFIKK